MHNAQPRYFYGCTERETVYTFASVPCLPVRACRYRPATTTPTALPEKQCTSAQAFVFTCFMYARTAPLHLTRVDKRNGDVRNIPFALACETNRDALANSKHVQ